MARARKSQQAADDEEPTEEQKAQEGSDVLTGAVTHGTRVYDPRKAKDQRDFKKLAETEGALADPSIKDKKERATAHEETLQHLADNRALRGYGTSTPKEERDEDQEETDLEEIRKQREEGYGA
jgi:hypothetical protein